MNLKELIDDAKREVREYEEDLKYNYIRKDSEYKDYLDSALAAFLELEALKSVR